MFNLKELKEYIMQLVAKDEHIPYVVGYGILKDTRIKFDKWKLKQKMPEIASNMQKLRINDSMSHLADFRYRNGEFPLSDFTTLKTGEVWNQLQSIEELQALDLFMACLDACGFVWKSEAMYSFLLSNDARIEAGNDDRWLQLLREKVVNNTYYTPLLIEISWISDDKVTVFEFIEDIVSTGINDADYYLTPIGAYIVCGYPFGNNWTEWAYFDLDDRYGCISLRDCPGEIAEKIQSDYEYKKSEWRINNGLEVKDMDTLELLHKQYLAVAAYAKKPNNRDTINAIAETYLATGINCLEYLLSLRELDEWYALSDFNEAQLCAVLTGHDPEHNPNNMLRSVLLRRMHTDFCHFTREIDKIASKRSLHRNKNDK